MDISDYSSCVGLGGQASASSGIEVKVPKVERVPGGCLHFAISLVPEAHPLAEVQIRSCAKVGSGGIVQPHLYSGPAGQGRISGRRDASGSLAKVPLRGSTRACSAGFEQPF